MGKLFEHIINDFSGGLSEDKRVNDLRRFSITKHFDTFTYSKKLVPYAKTEASNGLSGGVVTTLKLTRFLYAPNQSNLFRLYGLGDNGSGMIKLYKLDIDGASDLDTANWVAATNGESSSGTRVETVLFYYKSHLYMHQGTTSIARFDTTEVSAFTDSWQTVDDFTGDDGNAAPVPPLRHPSDDIAYFFGGSQVYALDGTSWEGSVLSLPTDQRIVARCAFGDYLAIACTTRGTFDKQSIIYLWDRDSSLTTLTERIDCGEGEIKHLGNLNNKLMIVMSFYLTNAYGLMQGRVIIKTPSGKFAVPLNEITTDTTLTAADMPQTNIVRQDKLYFPMKATLNGDTRLGIWAVDQNGKIALDYIEPLASTFRGIYATANLWWIAYNDGSGSYSVTRTDDDGAYSATNPSLIETLILNEGDGQIVKDLLGASITTQALPAGGKTVLKFRKDGATAWTTIFENTTVGSTNYDAVNIESDTTTFPQYKELELRAESYGGAVITGIKWKGETIDRQAY